MKKIPTPLMVLGIVSIIISIWAIRFLGQECHIEFIKSTTEITTLLIPYGILAMLIERFVNNFLLKEANETLKNQIRSVGLKEAVEKTDASGDKIEEKHTRKFFHRSFLIGFLVSALGYRFFTQITTDINCTAVSNSVYIFIYLDVFFTGILLSGGSQFINRIGQYLADGMKPS